MKPVFPLEKLKKGDLIGIAIPARPTDDLILQRCVLGIEKKGYRVLLPSNTGKSRGYLAGTDSERAHGFMETWSHKEVKAVWCYRGGYGSTRILDLLDYKAIRKNPKIFIGMSDITAMHLAIQKKTGLSTFLGPGLFSLFANEEKKDGYAEEELWRMICEPNPSLPYQYPLGFEEKYGPVDVIRKGSASGLSAGGNLSLICALIGTKYQIETKDRILFLEDVNEEPYKVDRMLQHLSHAGLLSKPAGVVLCTWKDCLSQSPHRSLTIQEVFHDYFANAPYPVLSGFPSGHIEHQSTILLNAPYSLDSEQKEVHLCFEKASDDERAVLKHSIQ